MHLDTLGCCVQSNSAVLVRTGNVLVLDDRLLEVVKSAHAVGHSRQLGNLQVNEFPPPVCSQFRATQVVTPLLTHRPAL